MSDLLLLLDNGDADFDVGEIPGGSAVAGPVFDAFGGPALDVWEPRGTVQVWSRAGVLVGTVDGAYGATWQERPYDDPGTASFTIQNDDPDLALCTTGRVARFLLDGEVRFAALIRKRFKTALSRSEEVGQATRVDGDGTLAVLASAIVLPDRSITDPATGTTRVFNFASLNLPGSAVTGPQSQTATPGVAEPVNFPVGTGAEWVGTTAVSNLETTFRQTITLGAAATARLHLAVTAPFTAWFDGQVIATSAAPYSRTKFMAYMHLAAGTHVLAVVADASLVVPVVKYALIEEDANGVRASVLAVSSASDVTAGPSRPVQWTAGSIMATLITEAQDRGCFPDLVVTFTETIDTNGTAWPGVTEFTVNVFNDLLMVVKQLAESGWGHFAMAPGAQVLHGYAAPGTSTTATMTPGSNIAELTHETVG